MHQTMRCHEKNGMLYYTCDALPVRHAFTTKAGGVSTGDCASLNLGFSRGDPAESVRRNYQIVADTLDVPFDRMTLTKQVHTDTVTTVQPAQVGTGLARPMDWQTDALITALPDTPLLGFGADCVVTLLCDPSAPAVGVCHGGWRGTALDIPGKTVRRMVQDCGADPARIIAVIGPSICQDCFETDADVPHAMRDALGAAADAFIQTRGAKFHVDLQGIQAYLLRQAGLPAAQIINSGLCTMCNSDIFWSHRKTNGRRGVQAAMICL